MKNILKVYLEGGFQMEKRKIKKKKRLYREKGSKFCISSRVTHNSFFFLVLLLLLLLVFVSCEVFLFFSFLFYRG